MGSAESPRPLGLSRTALFLNLARCQSAVQTDRAWRILGCNPTVILDACLHIIFWQARRSPFRWYSLSAFRLCRAFALDLFFKCSDQQRQQPCWKLEPDFKGLFPANDNSGSGGRSRTGRLCYCLCLAGWLDDLLRRCRHLEHCDGSGACDFDCASRAGRRDVDFSSECQIQRCALRTSFLNSAMDVRNAHNLSIEHSTCKVAMGAGVKPARGNHRRLSRLIIWAG